MSVIIREIYWQEYDTATQIRTVRADITCDAIADLPSGGVMTDYKLDIGSRAHVIADGSDWEIQSTGSWVRQPGKLQLDLTGYATTQYVDDGLAEKVDTTTYTAGQASQDAVIGTKITSADVFGSGSLIPDSADLNDYTVGGKYYGGNSAGNTVLNLPVPNGSFTFSVDVKQATPSMTYQYLRVCRLADDPYIYCRRRYNSWGAWYRFDGTQI